MKEGVENKVKNGLEVFVILHTLFYIARRSSSNENQNETSGNCNLQFPPLLNLPMLFFPNNPKLPIVLYNSLLY